MVAPLTLHHVALQFSPVVDLMSLKDLGKLEGGVLFDVALVVKLHVIIVTFSSYVLLRVFTIVEQQLHLVSDLLALVEALELLFVRIGQV